MQAEDPGKALDKLTQSNSRTVAQIALHWCLSKRGVVTIPKANSVDHLEDNCAASDFQLSAEKVQLLNVGIKFRRRGHLEIALRRVVRHVMQALGKNQ
jgi:diketogulonate reductase-like aldo/keto reductase